MTDFLQDNLRVFVVPVEIMEIPDLDIYEQMVYIVLRSFTNPRESTAFPSYNTIAKLGRMSRRKAIDSVASLVEKGLLKKEVRLDVTKNRKIRNTSNLYTISAPEVVRSAHQSSAQRAPEVVRSAHQGSAQRAPEQNQLTKSIKTKSINNKEKDDVVSKQNKIKDILSAHGIQTNDKIISKWLDLESEENILLAIEDTLNRKDIKNVIGYITRILETGFVPSTKTTQKSNLPIYNDQTTAFITKEDQKKALDLLLKLQEINQAEYNERLKKL